MILAIGTRSAAPAVAMLTWLLLSGGAWGEPMKTAGRTRGPSPLGVFFDATSAASGVLLPPEVNGRRDFSTYHYEWDFGDPRSPVFPSNGRSSNRAHGHLAAHIFAASALRHHGIGPGYSDPGVPCGLLFDAVGFHSGSISTRHPTTSLSQYTVRYSIRESSYRTGPGSFLGPPRKSLMALR